MRIHYTMGGLRINEKLNASKKANQSLDSAQPEKSPEASMEETESVETV